MSMSVAQLRELRRTADDEEKASEIRSVLVSQGMEHLLAGEPKNSSVECMRLQAYIQHGADGQSDSLRSSSLILSKSDLLCRYFTMPGGCVRGEKCLYSHPNAEIMSMEMGQSFMPRLLVGGTKRVGAEDLRKKIFVGGLLPSVESEDLRDFFELNYGPVVDAVVIGSQAGDQMQSRGFGFVTFKHAASVSAAVEAHYINIYGKKVEIKGAVPRSEMPALEGSRSDSESPIDPQVPLSANKALDLNEADVLEVATPGSLSLPKEEQSSQCNPSSAMAEPQQLSPSECAPSSLSGLPSSRTSNVSSDSFSKHVIRETSAESASSTSHGLPAANVSGVSGDPYSQSSMRGGSSGYMQEGKPAWLNTFKEWLPEFLTRVSMRLKEGEWYPLSSLKGDYRAICGLELDHVSIGFEKLSDFVRSFPELCRMKIVPVGRGPATHMVLLPPNSRTKPLVAPRRNLPNITTRSLVDGTRSYAEVAGHGSAARFGRPDTAPSSHPAFCAGGTNLVRQGANTGVLPTSSGERTYPTDRQPPIPFGLCQRNFPSRENGPGGAPCAAAAGYNAGLISSSNGPLRTSMTRAEGQSRSDSCHGSTVNSNSSSSDRTGGHAKLVHAADTEIVSAGEISSNSDVNPGLSEEDLGLLQELISRLKKTGIDQHVPARDHTATGSQPTLVTMRDALSSRQAPPGYQKPMTNVENERERSVKYFPIFDQEPKAPLLENIQLTNPFNHPFAGFLSENFPPNSSMWGQDANSNRIKEGVYGLHGRTVESINPACQFYEDSPDGNNSIYGTPRGYLSAPSNPGQGYLKMAGTCEICFERQAVWVAVPCGHKNICSVCKGSLRQDTAQCFVCNGYVERWIAIH